MILSDIPIFLQTNFELSSRVFSSNFVSAFFVIKTYKFYSYKRSKRKKSHQVLSSSRPMLEIKTMNKNKRQRSYQVIRTSGGGFWSDKWNKRTRNKIFIKSQKIPISSFIALNQAKEQGTRHRTLSFWFFKSCLIKA